ncbi:MAG: protein kinase [Myxococcales bacterium]|nr:MAG: protein kinase [Myxococcales bacterium]
MFEGFDLSPGYHLGSHYKVVRFLGCGSEGEVYQIEETKTGIHRAAKLYFESAVPSDKAVVWHAKKLNKLRHCPIVLQYHHTQTVQLRGRQVLCLISEFCEGVPLGLWVNSQPKKRLHPYLALHMLYWIVCGVERIHALGEYHSDIHSHNILVWPQGVGFNLKLVDFYNWGKPAPRKRKQDVIDAINVLYECLGGKKRYSKLSPQVKYICAGLKTDLILERFPTMSALRLHLETFDWYRIPSH